MLTDSKLDRITKEEIVIEKDSINLNSNQRDNNYQQTDINSPISGIKDDEKKSINDTNTYDVSKKEVLSVSTVIEFNNNLNDKIKNFCTVPLRRFYNIFVLILSLLLILITVYDLFGIKKDNDNKNKFLIKKWYINLFEIITGIMRISFFFLNLFVIKDKKITNIIIVLLNIIVIVLFIVVIFIILVKNDNFIARIINLDYCLFLFLSSLASILYIKAEVKKKKNVMQNIEEIINFTEINQHGNEKKFENEYFKGMIKQKEKGAKLVEEVTHKNNDETFSRNDKD